MIIDLLVSHIWLSLPILAAFHLSDYLLTLRAARWYASPRQKHLTFEGGYELNPRFSDDIAALRPPGAAFFSGVGAELVVLFGLWFFLLPTYPDSFEALYGGMLLVQFAIHVRHIQGIALLKHAAHSEGLKGSISYAQWLTYRISSVDLLSFAGLYFILLILTGRTLFFGGVIVCLLVADEHRRKSKKLRSSPQIGGETKSTPAQLSP